MNPLAIIGILVLSTASAIMMISYSNEQVQHSRTMEQISNIQSERLLENLLVDAKDGNLLLENNSPIPIHVREIRLLDDDGNVLYAQKADFSISSAQTHTYVPSTEISNAIDRLTQSGGMP